MSETSELLIEAKSLAEAKQQVPAKIPVGFYVLSEEVLSDGTEKTKSATGDTVAAAFLAAEKEIPSDAKILEKKEMTKPGKRVVEVKGFDVRPARELVEQQLQQYEIVEAIELKERGRQGFLGIGRSPNIYAGIVVLALVVEITYIELAKIRIKAKKRPTKPELMNSLDELERQTSAQWLRLDEPIQGAIAALMVMTAAFQFLKEKVSEPFNIILAEANMLFVEDKEPTLLEPLQLGPPEGAYDVSEIPLVSQQFKEAITRMRQLREFMKGGE